jgi:integrase
LTVLKAALNVAYKAGKAPSDDAWRKVEPFKKVDAAKLRYLNDDEAKRLVNACDPVFRPMVQAALLTGCRYGELASIRLPDVDLAAGTVWLTDTKARKARIAYLEAEGVRLFKTALAGKVGDALVFPRPDGERWAASQQARFLADACQNGKVDKTGFHDLRRTFGARLARRGVQMAVIAEALGDADERIVRKHYAHLSPSYLADTIRANVGGQGLVPPDNIEALALVG